MLLLHLVVWIQLLLLTQVVYGANNFRWYCDLDDEPIVELRWHPELDTYVVWDGYPDTFTTDPTTLYGDHNNDNAKRRQRRQLNWQESESSSSLLRGGGTQEDTSPTLFLGQEEAALSAMMSTSNRDLQQVNDGMMGATTNNSNKTMPEKVLVRRCPCWNPSGFQDKDFYCPLPRTHCGLGAGWTSINNNNNNNHPSSSSSSGPSFVYEDPGCLDIKRQESFARNVWPIVTVWYLAMFLCLCLTRPGRHAMGCCISKVWPGWNVYATNRIIRQNPEHANRIVFRHMAARSAVAAAASATTTATGTNGSTTTTNRLSYAGFEVTFELAPVVVENNTTTRGEEFLLRTKTFRYNNSNDDDRERKDCTVPDDGADAESTTEQSTNNDSLVTESPSNTITSEGDSRCGCESDNSIPETKQQQALKEEMPEEYYSFDNGDNKVECHHTDDDDDDAEEASVSMVVCTICHLEIEDGERVGDLPCGHTFHIDCLKSWIARRNVCPLCLAENIATPRRQPTAAAAAAPIASEAASSTGQSTMMPPELVVSGE